MRIAAHVDPKSGAAVGARPTAVQQCFVFQVRWSVHTPREPSDIMPLSPSLLHNRPAAAVQHFESPSPPIHLQPVDASASKGNEAVYFPSDLVCAELAQL
jgi:hypothetical protein